jgi:hypothetical protein
MCASGFMPGSRLTRVLARTLLRAGEMIEHMLVVVSRRLLVLREVMFVVFRVGTLLRGEMLRVPVVRGPKTFCKTIFHAKSLSEDQASMRRRRTSIS